MSFCWNIWSPLLLSDAYPGYFNRHGCDFTIITRSNRLLIINFSDKQKNDMKKLKKLTEKSENEVMMMKAITNEETSRSACKSATGNKYYQLLTLRHWAIVQSGKQANCDTVSLTANKHTVYLTMICCPLHSSIGVTKPRSGPPVSWHGYQLPERSV